MLRLYTDESPGLKVDPVVVLVLSLVFIFSVVALHSEFFSLVVLFLVEFLPCLGADLLMGLVVSYRQDYSSVLELDGLMRKGLGERERGCGLGGATIRGGSATPRARETYDSRMQGGDLVVPPTPEVLFVLFGVLGGVG